MFDENASQIELNDFVMHTLLDTSYIAVIGPETSPKAEKVATIFANYYKNYSSNPIPLMLPVATSVDLQRKYVDCDWCRCLSESNIAQSEILLTMVHSLLIDKINGHINIIYTSDSYGESFSIWLPFVANELNLPLGQSIEISPKINTKELSTILNNATTNSTINNPEVLLLLVDNLNLVVPLIQYLGA